MTSQEKRAHTKEVTELRRLLNVSEAEKNIVLEREMRHLAKITNLEGTIGVLHKDVQSEYKEARIIAKAANYYRDELVKAHALIGRLTHQLSEMVHTVHVDSYFPTNNVDNSKTHDNPTGIGGRLQYGANLQ